MKRLSFLSLLLAVLPLQAEMTNCQQECCQPCWDIEVYGEYLYWKVSEDQLQYAATVDVSDTGFIPLSGSLLSLLSTFAPTAGKISPTPLIAGLDHVDPDFQYNSGCRVGVGFNFGCCSNWQANIEYTRLHNITHSSVSDFVNGLFPTDYPLLPTLAFNAAFDHTEGLLLFSFIFPDSVTNAFQFRYDTVDLQFGVSRQCNCFSARPYFGGKVAWIRQRSHTSYLGLGFEIGVMEGVEEFFPTAASLNKTNDFRAGGVEIGADSALKFWGNLALTGGFQAALLYGHFSIESTPRFVPTGTDFPALVGKVNRFRGDCIRPMVDAYIGLDWDTCFCNRYIFSVGAAWELQYWWNQWQAPSSVDATIFKGGDAPQGDLSLQGLTVFASITF